MSAPSNPEQDGSATERQRSVDSTRCDSSVLKETAAQHGPQRRFVESSSLTLTFGSPQCGGVEVLLDSQFPLAELRVPTTGLVFARGPFASSLEMSRNLERVNASGGRTHAIRETDRSRPVGRRMQVGTTREERKENSRQHITQVDSQRRPEPGRYEGPFAGS
jgi:hypothetical protein